MPIEVNDLPEPDDLPELEFEIPDVQIDTMSGDVRDTVLALFKAHRKTWSDMTQTEQNMLVEGLGKFGRELVDQLVEAVTDWQFPRTVGRIADMKVIPGEKGRIEAKVHFQRIDDNLTAIGRHVGDMVAVLMFDSAALKGERAPARTDPDQPPLPMEAQEDPAAEEPIAAEAAPALLALPAPDKDAPAEEAPTEPESATEIQADADDFEASVAELEEQAPRQRRRKPVAA